MERTPDTRARKPVRRSARLWWTRFRHKGRSYYLDPFEIPGVTLLRQTFLSAWPGLFCYTGNWEGRREVEPDVIR